MDTTREECQISFHLCATGYARPASNGDNRRSEFALRHLPVLANHGVGMYRQSGCLILMVTNMIIIKVKQRIGYLRLAKKFQLCQVLPHRKACFKTAHQKRPLMCRSHVQTPI